MKACTEFAAKCIRTEQRRNSWPRVVTVSNCDISWAEHWHCDKGESTASQTSSMSPALKALGLTDAKGVATPGTDKNKSNQ